MRRSSDRFVQRDFSLARLARRRTGPGPMGRAVIVKGGRIPCLGAVIRGATPHFDCAAAEVAQGVAAVGRQSRVPTIFGVLAADTIEQAWERAGAKAGSKGFDAAASAIQMANLLEEQKSASIKRESK